MIFLVCCGVTFVACVLGTICGMGGGVIIKPLLDATGTMTVATVTFLSGCTVIAMSFWNVGKTVLKRDSVLDMKRTPFLALGAVLGGLLGKEIFHVLSSALQNKEMIGSVQSALLFAATFFTLLYTIKKDHLSSKEISSPAVCVSIGLCLGVLGAFLGIGGGPFNVAALCYFFSMPVKKATQNSLLIVLLSQTASIFRTLTASGVPPFDSRILFGMLLTAIAASEAGRYINKRIDETQATRWLEYVMTLIMLICLYNIYQFAH